MKFGIATAAKMPMMAITIISSIRVKPFWLASILSLLIFMMFLSVVLVAGGVAAVIRPFSFALV